MPDTVHLPILCRAPVTYMPARGQSPKTAIVEFTVDVLAPSISASDAAIAMTHKESRRVVHCRRFGGLLWMTDTFVNTTPADLRPILAQDTNLRRHLVGGADMIPSGARKGSVPAGVRIIDDGRPAAEARLRQSASRIGFIDGQLWIGGLAPGLHIEVPYTGNPRIVVRRHKPGEESGYGFGLDRGAELLDFVRANVFPGGYKDAPKPLDFEFDSTVPWAYPERRVNTRMAVREALNALSHGLVDHPPAILGYVRDLAEIREALPPETWRPELAAEAGALLAAMEETRLNLKGLHLLGHAIRLGRDAIARSVEVIEADMESLAALA